MQIETYNLTPTELEDFIDVAKVNILNSLVWEGLIKSTLDAEEWCRTHTVVIRKKSFFRTLSDKWFKQKDDKGVALLVIKVIESKNIIEIKEEIDFSTGNTGNTGSCGHR